MGKEHNEVSTLKDQFWNESTTRKIKSEILKETSSLSAADSGATHDNLPLAIDNFLCLSGTVPGELLIYPSKVLFKPQLPAAINAALSIHMDQVQAVTADSTGYVLGKIHLRTSQPGESLRDYEFFFTHRLESCLELLRIVLRARSNGASIRITELFPATTRLAPLPQHKQSPEPVSVPPAMRREVQPQPLCARNGEEELPLKELCRTTTHGNENEEEARPHVKFRRTRTFVALSLLALALGVVWTAASMLREEIRPVTAVDWSTWRPTSTWLRDVHAGFEARLNRKKDDRVRRVESPHPQMTESTPVQPPLLSPTKKNTSLSQVLSSYKPAPPPSAEPSTTTTSAIGTNAQPHPQADESKERSAPHSSKSCSTARLSGNLGDAYNRFAAAAECAMHTTARALRTVTGRDNTTPVPSHPPPSPPPPPPPLSEPSSASVETRFVVWVGAARRAMEAAGETLTGLAHSLLPHIAVGARFVGRWTEAAATKITGATPAMAVSPYLPGAAVAGLLILILAAAPVASDWRRGRGVGSRIERGVGPPGSIQQKDECGMPPQIPGDAAGEAASLRAALKDAELEAELERQRSQVAQAEHSLEVDRLRRRKAKYALEAAKAVHRAKVLETMVNEDKRRAHMLETQTKKKNSRGLSASRHEPKLMPTAQMQEEVEHEVMLQEEENKRFEEQRREEILASILAKEFIAKRVGPSQHQSRGIRRHA